MERTSMQTVARNENCQMFLISFQGAFYWSDKLRRWRRVFQYVYFSPFFSILRADPSGRATLWRASAAQTACCVCGFESRRGHWCLSLVSVVCCQVEVCETSRYFVKRSPADCDVSLSVIKGISRMWWPWPTLGCCAGETKNVYAFCYRVRTCSLLGPVLFQINPVVSFYLN